MGWVGGGWKNWEHCPPESWATGLRIRVDKTMGDGDATCLNAIGLRCVNAYGAETAWIHSHGGGWGEWAISQHLNGNGRFFVGAEFLVEGNCAATAVMFELQHSMISLGSTFSAEKVTEVAKELMVKSNSVISVSRELNLVWKPATTADIPKHEVICQEKIDQIKARLTVNECACSNVKKFCS